MRLTISVYELGAGMGVDECSCDSFTGDSLDSGGDGVIASSSFTVERDKGAGAALNNLLMCLGRNHGKGSRMSSGPWGITEGAVMGRGIMPPWVADSVGNCGTELGVSVGITGDAGMLSCVGMLGSLLASVLRSAGSWRRGLARLHCENVTL